MNNVLSIQSALLEIRDAALNDFENATKTYDLIIGGNVIYASEFRFCLEKSFGIPLSIDEMHQLIPAACQGLGMKCQPMRALSDLDNPVPADYSIQLHD